LRNEIGRKDPVEDPRADWWHCVEDIEGPFSLMLHDALRYFRHGTYSDAADKSRVRGQMVERSNDWGKRDEEAIALDAKRHMGTGPVWTKEEEVEWGSRKENKGQCLSAKGPKKARQDSA
jgi:hypothetical protein